MTTPERDDQSHRDDDLLDAAAASDLLDVPSDRIPAMVEEGLLTPVGGSGELRFRRAEVVAVRELGG